jgi:hypothetical protein
MAEYSKKIVSYLNVVLYLKFSPSLEAKKARLKPTLVASLFNICPNKTRSG